MRSSGRPHCARALRGWTLIEALVVLAVLAGLSSTALMAMGRWVSEWQRDRATRAMTQTLALARSHAIRTNGHVVVCNSADGLRCAPSSEKDWKSGWLVFQDANANGQRDTDEAVVAVREALSGIRSLQANNRIRRFDFLPSGLMAAGMATLTVVPQEGASQKIVVSRTGRIRLSMDDGAPD
jgi:type IV fimbrial biogenesis protein FimT